ncbi:hypothetical protein BDW02DRAFT_535188 [Decorospora gaudefroyi]|uniref:MYND-type domain-containing protein n=1 Tax=Decorospora gaudefroyi TaxID=184978 RepID=A0A6A5K988_9PLEO|nr:hypothetical protein BDW02DRAFT_535188 [Decorospora gaudefroyi]
MKGFSLVDSINTSYTNFYRHNCTRDPIRYVHYHYEVARQRLHHLPRGQPAEHMQKCKVVQYCGRDHQVADWPTHKDVCKTIRLARKERRAEQVEEQMLATLAAELSQTIPMADEGCDLDALLKLARAELKVDTRRAVESALGHLLETTRHAKNGMMGVAELVPASLLRLGRDQEAYDFMKWVLTPDVLFNSPKRPYTAIKNENVLEPSTVFTGKTPSLGFISILTLLKFRVLIDLEALQRRLPQELIDNIHKNMVSSAITRETIECADHREDIASVRADVISLYDATKTWNPTFWPAVLRPGDDRSAQTEDESMAVEDTYKAWAETPGAIEALQALSREF